MSSRDWLVNFTALLINFFLEVTSNEYVAEFNDLLEMYDSICEITDDAVPAAIKADFQKVKSENSVLLHKVDVEKCKLVDSDPSNRSDSESVVSVASAPVTSKSHQQPVQDPSAEPKVFLVTPFNTPNGVARLMNLLQVDRFEVPFFELIFQITPSPFYRF